jgi:hypothetical protein
MGRMSLFELSRIMAEAMGLSNDEGFYNLRIHQRVSMNEVIVDTEADLDGSSEVYLRA